MSAPVTSNSSNFCQELTTLAINSATFAGVTAFTAAVFTSINPVAGAIIGVTSIINGRAMNWIYEKTNCCPNNMATQVARAITGFATGVILGTFIAQAAGYSVTFGSVAILTLLSIPVAIAGGLCLFAVVALVTAAIVAIAARTGYLNPEDVRVPEQLPGAQYMNQTFQQIQEAIRNRQAAATQATV